MVMYLPLGPRQDEGAAHPGGAGWWASWGPGPDPGVTPKPTLRLGVSGQQRIGKTTTVLGTREFSGFTGGPGLCGFYGRYPSQGA